LKNAVDQQARAKAKKPKLRIKLQFKILRKNIKKISKLNPIKFQTPKKFKALFPIICINKNQKRLTIPFTTSTPPTTL
jgi:hypothetical protein